MFFSSFSITTAISEVWVILAISIDYIKSVSVEQFFDRNNDVHMIYTCATQTLILLNLAFQFVCRKYSFWSYAIIHLIYRKPLKVYQALGKSELLIFCSFKACLHFYLEVEGRMTKFEIDLFLL